MIFWRENATENKKLQAWSAYVACKLIIQFEYKAKVKSQQN